MAPRVYCPGDPTKDQGNCSLLRWRGIDSVLEQLPGLLRLHSFYPRGRQTFLIPGEAKEEVCRTIR